MSHDLISSRLKFHQFHSLFSWKFTTGRHRFSPSLAKGTTAFNSTRLENNRFENFEQKVEYEFFVSLYAGGRSRLATLVFQRHLVP
jgi:hypothetical protein